MCVVLRPSIYGNLRKLIQVSIVVGSRVPQKHASLLPISDRNPTTQTPGILVPMFQRNTPLTNQEAFAITKAEGCL